MSQTEITYDSSNLKPSYIEEYIGVIQYRRLILRLISRVIKTRYKRSMFGVAWTMLNPLLTMTIMTIVFSNLFRFNVENYPVYLLSGLLAWNFFVNATSNSMEEMLSGLIMAKKIYVPKSVFVFTAVGAELINLFLSLILLLLIMLVTGVSFHLSLFILPLSILIITLFAAGVGLILAMIVMFFADMAQIYRVILMLLMYASPIMYPKEIVPEKWSWLLTLNPFTYILTIIRDPIFNGTLTQPLHFLIALLIAIITFSIGWFLFTSKSGEYAYRV
ncbi:MAG: ABC transporter permease [Anaerolineaceae bacterium]|nr:ABC transporter permease [Anaerolineaceae bacterium]